MFLSSAVVAQRRQTTRNEEESTKRLADESTSNNNTLSVSAKGSSLDISTNNLSIPPTQTLGSSTMREPAVELNDHKMTAQSSYSDPGSTEQRSVSEDSNLSSIIDGKYKMWNMSNNHTAISSFDDLCSSGGLRRCGSVQRNLQQIAKPPTPSPLASLSGSGGFSFWNTRDLVVERPLDEFSSTGLVPHYRSGPHVSPVPPPLSSYRSSFGSPGWMQQESRGGLSPSFFSESRTGDRREHVESTVFEKNKGNLSSALGTFLSQRWTVVPSVLSGTSDPKLNSKTESFSTKHDKQKNFNGDGEGIKKTSNDERRNDGDGKSNRNGSKQNSQVDGNRLPDKKSKIKLSGNRNYNKETSGATEPFANYAPVKSSYELLEMLNSQPATSSYWQSPKHQSHSSESRSDTRQYYINGIDNTSFGSQGIEPNSNVSTRVISMNRNGVNALTGVPDMVSNSSQHIQQYGQTTQPADLTKLNSQSHAMSSKSRQVLLHSPSNQPATFKRGESLQINSTRFSTGGQPVLNPAHSDNNNNEIQQIQNTILQHNKVPHQLQSSNPSSGSTHPLLTRQASGSHNPRASSGLINSGTNGSHFISQVMKSPSSAFIEKAGAPGTITSGRFPSSTGGDTNSPSSQSEARVYPSNRSVPIVPQRFSIPMSLYDTTASLGDINAWVPRTGRQNLYARQPSESAIFKATQRTEWQGHWSPLSRDLTAGSDFSNDQRQQGVGSPKSLRATLQPDSRSSQPVWKDFSHLVGSTDIKSPSGDGNSSGSLTRQAEHGKHLETPSTSSTQGKEIIEDSSGHEKKTELERKVCRSRTAEDSRSVVRSIRSTIYSTESGSPLNHTTNKNGTDKMTGSKISSSENKRSELSDRHNNQNLKNSFNKTTNNDNNTKVKPNSSHKNSPDSQNESKLNSPPSELTICGMPVSAVANSPPSCRDGKHFKSSQPSRIRRTGMARPSCTKTSELHFSDISINNNQNNNNEIDGEDLTERPLWKGSNDDNNSSSAGPLDNNLIGIPSHAISNAQRNVNFSSDNKNLSRNKLVSDTSAIQLDGFAKTRGKDSLPGTFGIANPKSFPDSFLLSHPLNPIGKDDTSTILGRTNRSLSCGAGDQSSLFMNPTSPIGDPFEDVDDDDAFFMEGATWGPRDRSFSSPLMHSSSSGFSPNDRIPSPVIGLTCTPPGSKRLVSPVVSPKMQASMMKSEFLSKSGFKLSPLSSPHKSSECESLADLSTSSCTRSIYTLIDSCETCIAADITALTGQKNSPLSDNLDSQVPLTGSNFLEECNTIILHLYEQSCTTGLVDDAPSSVVNWLHKGTDVVAEFVQELLAVILRKAGSYAQSFPEDVQVRRSYIVYEAMAASLGAMGSLAPSVWRPISCRSAFIVSGSVRLREALEWCALVEILILYRTRIILALLTAVEGPPKYFGSMQHIFRLILLLANADGRGIDDFVPFLYQSKWLMNFFPHFSRPGYSDLLLNVLGAGSQSSPQIQPRTFELLRTPLRLSAEEIRNLSSEASVDDKAATQSSESNRLKSNFSDEECDKLVNTRRGRSFSAGSASLRALGLVDPTADCSCGQKDLGKVCGHSPGPRRRDLRKQGGVVEDSVMDFYDLFGDFVGQFCKSVANFSSVSCYCLYGNESQFMCQSSQTKRRRLAVACFSNSHSQSSLGCSLDTPKGERSVGSLFDGETDKKHKESTESLNSAVSCLSATMSASSSSWKTVKESVGDNPCCRANRTTVTLCIRKKRCIRVLWRSHHNFNQGLSGAAAGAVTEDGSDIRSRQSEGFESLVSEEDATCLSPEKEVNVSPKFDDVNDSNCETTRQRFLRGEGDNHRSEAQSPLPPSQSGTRKRTRSHGAQSSSRLSHFSGDGTSSGDLKRMKCGQESHLMDGDCRDWTYLKQKRKSACLLTGEFEWSLPNRGSTKLSEFSKRSISKDCLFEQPTMDTLGILSPSGPLILEVKGKRTDLSLEQCDGQEDKSRNSSRVKFVFLSKSKVVARRRRAKNEQQTEKLTEPCPNIGKTVWRFKTNRKRDNLIKLEEIDHEFALQEKLEEILDVRIGDNRKQMKFPNHSRCTTCETSDLHNGRRHHPFSSSHSSCEAAGLDAISCRRLRERFESILVFLDRLTNGCLKTEYVQFRTAVVADNTSTAAQGLSDLLSPPSGLDSACNGSGDPGDLKRGILSDLNTSSLTCSMTNLVVWLQMCVRNGVLLRLLLLFNVFNTRLPGDHVPELLVCNNEKGAIRSNKETFKKKNQGHGLDASVSWEIDPKSNQLLNSGRKMTWSSSAENLSFSKECKSHKLTGSSSQRRSNSRTNYIEERNASNMRNKNTKNFRKRSSKTDKYFKMLSESLIVGPTAVSVHVQNRLGGKRSSENCPTFTQESMSETCISIRDENQKFFGTLMETLTSISSLVSVSAFEVQQPVTAAFDSSLRKGICRFVLFQLRGLSAIIRRYKQINRNKKLKEYCSEEEKRISDGTETDNLMQSASSIPIAGNVATGQRRCDRDTKHPVSRYDAFYMNRPHEFPLNLLNSDKFLTDYSHQVDFTDAETEHLLSCDELIRYDNSPSSLICHFVNVGPEFESEDVVRRDVEKDIFRVRDSSDMFSAFPRLNDDRQIKEAANLESNKTSSCSQNGSETHQQNYKPGNNDDAKQPSDGAKLCPNDTKNLETHRSKYYRFERWRMRLRKTKIKRRIHKHKIIWEKLKHDVSSNISSPVKWDKVILNPADRYFLVACTSFLSKALDQISRNSFPQPLLTTSDEDSCMQEMFSCLCELFTEDEIIYSDIFSINICIILKHMLLTTPTRVLDKVLQQSNFLPLFVQRLALAFRRARFSLDIASTWLDMGVTLFHMSQIAASLDLKSDCQWQCAESYMSLTLGDILKFTPMPPESQYVGTSRNDDNWSSQPLSSSEMTATGDTSGEGLSAIQGEAIVNLSRQFLSAALSVQQPSWNQHFLRNRIKIQTALDNVRTVVVYLNDDSIADWKYVSDCLRPHVKNMAPKKIDTSRMTSLEQTKKLRDNRKTVERNERQRRNDQRMERGSCLNVIL